jgi:hypothetical protein
MWVKIGIFARMIRTSFTPKARPKSFGYEPRHYKPKDERPLVDRIKFESKVRRGQGKSIFVLFVLLSAVLYIIYKIGS